MPKKFYETEEQRKAVMARFAKQGGSKEQFREFHESTAKDVQKRDLWFKSEKESNWQKDDSIEQRRKKVFDSSDKRLTERGRFKWCWNKMNALSNVSKDTDTKTKSKDDANYFLKRMHSLD